MTHSACGECKHCEMWEQNQDKLYLSAIFSSSYKYADLFRCSAVYWDWCDAVVTGLKDIREQKVFTVFPTQVYEKLKLVLSPLTKHPCWQKHWFCPSSCSALRQKKSPPKIQFSKLSCAEKQCCVRCQNMSGLTSTVLLNGCQHKHAVFAGSCAFLYRKWLSDMRLELIPGALW